MCYFQNLLEKQASDSKLVQHLVHVGTLADEIANSDLPLSTSSRNILNNLCLYHAIGGQLTDEGERQEEKIIKAFRKKYPEVRFDIANNDVYLNDGDLESTQITIGAAINYAF